jgi:hypothetical protein
LDDAAFIRYLSAKSPIDDRSINLRIWEAMVARVPADPRVAEIGAGIGTMVDRAVRDGRLRPRGWTLVDAQPGLLEEARQRLGDRVPFPVELVPAPLDEWLSSRPGGFDLVVASAFLDLVDVRRVLPRLLPLAAPGRPFYFPITFDGLTALEPGIDAALDRAIIDAYHLTMDERLIDGAPSGDSRSGRHLLTLLPAAGYRVLEAGSSDWVVLPRDGRYPGDEAFFLECILAFFEESLSGRADVDQVGLRWWLASRRAQISRGELVFIAHQLDLLAERPG